MAARKAKTTAGAAQKRTTTPKKRALKPKKESPYQNTNPVFKGVPTEHLPLPIDVPITAAGYIAFLPNNLRKPYLPFHFASNGATTKTIANMHKHYLHYPECKEIIDHTTYGSMSQKSVRQVKGIKIPAFKKVRKGGKGKGKSVRQPWTFSTHVKYNLKDKFGAWNAQDPSLADFASLLRGINKSMVDEDNQSNPEVHAEEGNDADGESETDENGPQNIAMASLGNDLKRFPSIETGDGFQISRCVKYAVDHPHEDWQFTRDVTKLIKMLPPLTIEGKHYDSAVFARFKAGEPASTSPEMACTTVVEMPQAAIPKYARGRRAAAPTKVTKTSSSSSQARAAHGTAATRSRRNVLTEAQEQELECWTSVLHLPTNVQPVPAPAYVHPSMASRNGFTGSILPPRASAPVTPRSQPAPPPPQSSESPDFDFDQLLDFESPQSQSALYLDDGIVASPYDHGMYVDMGAGPLFEFDFDLLATAPTPDNLHTLPTAERLYEGDVYGDNPFDPFPYM